MPGFLTAAPDEYSDDNLDKKPTDLPLQAKPYHQFSSILSIEMKLFTIIIKKHRVNTRKIIPSTSDSV